MKCEHCDGEGQVADTANQGPWSMWENLPLASSAAVTVFLVRPIDCPRCGGTGEVPE